MTKSSNAIETLQVMARTREIVKYKGPALAVTSFNEDGLFDVLPRHSNFITLIKDYIIIHKTDRTEEKIPLKIGVMSVTNNVVAIYIGVLQQPIISANLQKGPK